MARGREKPRRARLPGAKPSKKVPPACILPDTQPPLAILRLPSRWVWGVPATTGRAVELSDISSFRDTGFTEWGLDAARPGTWTFRTTGQPGSKRFSVKIRVR